MIESNGEYRIKIKINAATAADTAVAHLVQDRSGGMNLRYPQIMCECVLVRQRVHSYGVRVRCRQALLLLLLWKKTRCTTIGQTTYRLLA